MNVVLFYDVSDVDDTGRYDLIKGHLQTRAVENVSTIVSVDSIHPYQTAPTAVFGKSGQILKECTRNQPEFLIYDFEKTEDDFGETGRRTISDTTLNIGMAFVLWPSNDIWCRFFVSGEKEWISLVP